jgi:hypothetical protein
VLVFSHDLGIKLGVSGVYVELANHEQPQLPLRLTYEFLQYTIGSLEIPNDLKSKAE